MGDRRWGDRRVGCGGWATTLSATHRRRVPTGRTRSAAVATSLPSYRQAQLLVLLQLEDVVLQQLDVLQLHVLELLQLHAQVAATSMDRSARSQTSKVSLSSSCSSMLRLGIIVVTSLLLGRSRRWSGAGGQAQLLVLPQLLLVVLHVLLVEQLQQLVEQSAGVSTPSSGRSQTSNVSLSSSRSSADR